MRITVIGTGYLGAVHATCMAESGHEVLGVDVDPARLAALNEGEAAVLRARTSRATAAHRCLRCTAVQHVACGGWRVRRRALRLCRHAAEPGSNAADLSQVEAVADGLAPHLRPGALVVGKSTVPVGTAARLADRIGRLAEDADAELAWNPEFLSEGTAVQDTLRPDRLVVGVTSGRADALLRKVYAPMIAAGMPVHQHRSSHRRAGQGGRELFPGHQDLVYQRDGRRVRRRPAGMS